MNLISRIQNLKDFSVMGATPFKVNIPKSGNYYIKVYSTSRIGDYRFFIGTPDYTIDSYTYHPINPLTLTTESDSVQDTYDLRNIDSVSDKAVVYSVSSTYPRISDISNDQISIKLDSDYSWIPIYRYSTNENNVSVYDKKPLKSLWTYKLEGNVSKYMEFTPEVTFNYVYPVLPK
ncbi:hypothetical protein J2Z42_000567 [Clostridium algifaecis]|uniref:Uncharacterized protein n=2 Tax=Clostridium algifaecis TaxID=1472040 RepID=A0ABS4KPC9_9CLOT|nr:hypothetical protein [Clostridium algifaecis]